MPLWTKTEEAAGYPTWIDLSTYAAGTVLLLIDETEAQDSANIAKGLCTPGWYLYLEYDAGGETRHKAELIVPMDELVSVGGPFYPGASLYPSGTLYPQS